ncbi:MAG TPA: hypothetical protein VL263_05115, partial [Vicinamibacterales bacterium]|nr:hypothetical protein [Vicinamibacterales bacterium]
MRDLLILSVDKSRASDADVVGDSDRERLLQLVGRWSREDLLRGFDLMTRVEQEIRASDQPRYNMEMALLRLMHLRKLVPLTDLLTGAAGATGAMGATRVPGATRATGATGATGASRAPASPPIARPSNTNRPGPPSGVPSASAVATAAAPPRTGTAPGTSYRDALLAEIKAAKPIFYNLVVAQAFSIEADESGVTFTFQPNQKVPKQQCEENRGLVQTLVEKLTGEKRPVRIGFTDGSAPAAAGPPSAPPGPAPAPVSGERKDAMMQNPTVRHLLEVFPVEKTTVQDE